MKTHNSKSVKIQNTKLAIEKLVELRETSRSKLAKLTTLNKATISTIINELIDKKIVNETNKIYKTSGRSAKIIELNKNAGRIISIDLLTNSIYGVIANLYGEILYEIKTPVDNTDFSFYFKKIIKTIDKLKLNTHDSTYGIIGIGLGVYGILSNDKKIKFATFTSWKDIELKKIIENYTGYKTYVENEANLSALGEKIIYNNYPNLVSLNIGIGVGMGIVIDDKLYTGEDGYAGEIGHTILIPNGKKCVCGNYGCLERYISDTGIEEKYYELAKKSITINKYIELYKKDEKHAKIIYNQFIDYLSITINNICQILNPSVIVINSKIADNIPETISLIKNKIRSKIVNIEILTISSFKAKTNVLGLTHILIQDFLNIDKYKAPL